MADLDFAVCIAAEIWDEPRWGLRRRAADLDFAVRIAEEAGEPRAAGEAGAGADGRPRCGRHHPLIQRARILSRWREGGTGRRAAGDKRAELHIRSVNFRAVRRDDLLPLCGVSSSGRSSTSSSACEGQLQRRHYSTLEPRAFLSAAFCQPWESAVDVSRRFPLCADEVSEQDRRYASPRFITDTKYAAADLLQGHITDYCASAFRLHGNYELAC